MLPIKINTDLDPTAVPENSSRLNVNINVDILKNAVVNEQGFDIVPLTSDTRFIIGNCMLSDNSIVIFSKLNSALYQEEIGILKNNIYSVILRGNNSFPDPATLGFSTRNLIQCESKVNFNGDEIVYWVDGLNSDKWLNVTNPQIQRTDDFRILNSAQLKLLQAFKPEVSDLPDQTTTLIDSGSLFSGVYQISVVYGDQFKNYTQSILFSSPIPVTASTGDFDVKYIGSKANTLTNKAIKITLPSSSLNREFSFLKVLVVSKINQVFKAYEFEEYGIPTTGDFSCIIDTLVDKKEVSVDSLIINKARYKSSLTLTQLDDVMYKAHLKSRPKINLQPYVNNIQVNYIQKEVNLQDVVAGENFKDPNMCFYSKGFMYDEIYALYASFTIDDGDTEYETDAYTIPGRLATTIPLGGTTIPLENTKLSDLLPTDYNSLNNFDVGQPFNKFLTLDPDARIFHALDTSNNFFSAPTNMGYWENQNETYSNENKWITVDSNGTPIAGKDFRNQKVRHHKFPEAYPNNRVTLSPTLTDAIHPSNTNYNIVNLLGVQLSNIVLPTEIQGSVKKINLYYAKRDLNNRTILGQSLLQSLSQIHVGDLAAYGTGNSVWNNGGQWVGKEMLQGNSRNGGIFPVGYERTTLQNSSQWMYSDNNFINPFFWGKGYYKCKPFDLQSQSISVNSATHIKNLYRVRSIYKQDVFSGVGLNDDNKNVITLFLFDPTNSQNTDTIKPAYFGGIDRLVNNSESLKNNIRLISNSSYVDLNFPNQGNVSINTPYPFFAYPFNYGGDKSIWLETDQYLYSWNLSAGTNQAWSDFGETTYTSNAAFKSPTMFSSPYISNICTHKQNLFQSFDSQVLCLAGSMSINTTVDFYNGDTFTTINSDRGGVETTNYSPSRPNQVGFMRSVHCYITQSTSNINYRYRGDNSWETFYPYDFYQTVVSIPVTDPEWYGYNIDYSSVNDLKQPVIESNFNNQFQTKFPNRVIRSAKDNPELTEDNYLDFQAGDYKDFGKIKGKIRNITNQNNKLLIKTDNALYATLGREVISTEGAEANVTSGDIFAVKPREIVTSDSYGGGLGRFADIVTQYGYMYPDTTNGIVYNFNGDALDEISRSGQEIFFRNELRLKLPQTITPALFNSFPNYNILTTYVPNYYVKYNNKIWKTLSSGILTAPKKGPLWEEVDYSFQNIDSIIDKQSIGVQAAFDYKYKRYILTKKDYIFNGFPNTFITNIPLIYNSSFNTKIVWFEGIYYSIQEFNTPGNRLNYTYLTSRSNGTSTVYIYGQEVDLLSLNCIQDRFTIAYYPELQGWVSHYTFFPDAFCYNIDSVYSFTNSQNTIIHEHNSNLQNSFFYNREVPYQSFVEPILNEPKGCKLTSSISIKSDSYRKDNTLDYLNSFSDYFVRNSYQISKEVEFDNTKTSRNSEGYFNINDFRDLTKDNSQPLMTSNIINEPNLSNINPNKHWTKQKKFVDYYIIPRLINNPGFKLFSGELSLDAGDQTFSITTPVELGDIIKFTHLGTTYVIYLNRVVDGNNGNFLMLTNNTILVDIFDIPTYEILKTRQLNLLDVSRLEHKNTR